MSTATATVRLGLEDEFSARADVIRARLGIRADHYIAGADGGRVLTGPDRLEVLARHFPNAVSAAGLNAQGWTVTLDPALPGDVLVYRPGLLLITVREEGDLTALLNVNVERGRAARFLRAKVLETAHGLGLPLRPFARPATRGAHR